MNTTDTAVARPPRLLRIVMRLDSIFSFTYAPVVVGALAALAIFHPHGLVLALIWSILAFIGFSLGILGIFMAVGLTRAMMRGDEISEQWYVSLFDC